MADYKTMSALLGGSHEKALETIKTPLEELCLTARKMSELKPTEPNEKARQSLENVSEKLKACLSMANPLNVFGPR